MRFICLKMFLIYLGVAKFASGQNKWWISAWEIEILISSPVAVVQITSWNAENVLQEAK